MTAGPTNGNSGCQVSMWATRWRCRLRWQTLRLSVMRTCGATHVKANTGPWRWRMISILPRLPTPCGWTCPVVYLGG